MPKRQIQYRKLRKISIGDMRECITLENRSIEAPSFDSTSFTQDYRRIIETWAKIETEFKNRRFDDVEIEQKPSHKFTIRYRCDVTTISKVT